jgi:hypothetical protein
MKKRPDGSKEKYYQHFLDTSDKFTNTNINYGLHYRNEAIIPNSCVLITNYGNTEIAFIFYLQNMPFNLTELTAKHGRRIGTYNIELGLCFDLM